MSLFESSCRVAFAGMLQGIGSLLSRAGLSLNDKDGSDKVISFITKFSPFAFNDEFSPFSKNNEKGSISEFIESIHNEDSFMKKLIDEASYISIGINREEYEKDFIKQGQHHNQDLFLDSLFEQIRLESDLKQEYKYAYKIAPLSCSSLFPCKKTELKADDKSVKDAYLNLWKTLCEDLEKKIPESHRSDWKLWIDHFDSALLSSTAMIPFISSVSGGNASRSDVSLYDHLKTTAAVAVALWRYHHETGSESVDDLCSDKSMDTDRFLLIQGDFFSIQDFIFSEGSKTNKNGAKLLRGRSFYVSLLTELAALKVLEALDLPSVSQINNAAGKFMILAPNTQETLQKLKKAREQLSRWFLDMTFGKTNIGIVWTTAKSSDFYHKKLGQLITKIFDDLDRVKYKSFDLCSLKTPVFDADYSKGVCDYNGYIPADRVDNDGTRSCAISRDQIFIGDSLVKGKSRLVICESSKAPSLGLKVSELSVFGYSFAFASDKEDRILDTENILRYWDFSLPKNSDSPLFCGLARRNINCYIPFFTDSDMSAVDKYEGACDEEPKLHALKTFHHLAYEDRIPKDSTSSKWIGHRAIMSLKGDVDNLGITFQKGLIDSDDKKIASENRRHASFAKTCGLSRITNSFFASYLPFLCKEDFKNTYTIYAGGDDFFMLGPWKEIQKLAVSMRQKFTEYTAFNPEVHFSAGMVMIPPSTPLATIASASEEALESAKQIDSGKKVSLSEGKDAVCLFGRVVKWSRLSDESKPEENLMKVQKTLEDNQENWGISQVFLYSLFNIIELADRRNDPKSYIWRSRLSYKIARIMQDKYRGEENAEKKIKNTKEVIQSLTKAIETFGGDLRIALSNIFYSIREE